MAADLDDDFSGLNIEHGRFVYVYVYDIVCFVSLLFAIIHVMINRKGDARYYWSLFLFPVCSILNKMQVNIRHTCYHTSTITLV